MYELFKNEYDKDYYECIDSIEKAALQYNIGEIDEYRQAIAKLLKHTGNKIDKYFLDLKNDLKNDYFIVMIYYSHRIKENHLKRISQPIKKEVKIDNKEHRERAEQFVNWHDRKWEKGDAFSLIPKSLAGHERKHKPVKYLLQLKDEDVVKNIPEVEILNISCCYEDDEKWKSLFYLEKPSNDEDARKQANLILTEIEESRLLDNQACKVTIREINKINSAKEDLTMTQVIPFIMAWYPLKEYWPFQYYIPSPMLSDAPVGGLLIGTKKMLDKEDIDNLEDIALKVTIDINFLEHKEKVMDQSRRTAVAAIMGRNLSHNIGSHVLWQLAQEPEEDTYKTKKDIEKQNDFYSYIRERMGFIGLISTTTPSWTLEYDLSKIIADFDRQDFLKQNLVKTEKKELKIKIVSDSCKKDIELSHGSYGAHAFFTILENIIRNSVKHNIVHVGDEIVFTISSEDSEKYKNYVQVKIKDNLKKYSKDLDALKRDLNKKTKENIIDENGKLINKHLGFKEKRICSAFLRLIPQEAVDCKFEIPLLEVEKIGNNLTHVIHLKKPKKALIVTEDIKILCKKDDLLNKGFYVEKKDLLDKVSDFTYQFLVLDFDINGETKKFLEENKQRLPLRILEKRDFTENSIPEDISKLDLFLWKTWFYKYFCKDGRANQEIRLIDGRNEDWERSINNECNDNKIKVIRNKTDDRDYIPDNSIVISHDININVQKNIYSGSYCIEGTSGGDSLDIMIKSIKGNVHHLYKLLESFLFKIVIVDERIYDKVDTMVPVQPQKIWNGKISFNQLWSKRQVEIIDHNEIIEKDNWSSIFSSKPDILIIHLGVIDKYNDTHNIQKFKNAWDEIKEKINYIIIDSDRGRSDDIKAMGARWLQFSDLSNVIIDKAEDNMAKCLLLNLISAIRED